MWNIRKHHPDMTMPNERDRERKRVGPQFFKASITFENPSLDISFIP